jgi:hypothetical protein
LSAPLSGRLSRGEELAEGLDGTQRHEQIRAIVRDIFRKRAFPIELHKMLLPPPPPQRFGEHPKLGYSVVRVPCASNGLTSLLPLRPQARAAEKTGRPQTGRPDLAKSSGEEEKTYKDGGFALAVGVWLLGACAGVVPVPVLVIRWISTRRFLARPPGVLLVSTGLSLPSPIR